MNGTISEYPVIVFLPPCLKTELDDTALVVFRGGILLGSPLAVAKAEATLPGVQKLSPLARK